jgi:hypothetical protein
MTPRCVASDGGNRGEVDGPDRAVFQIGNASSYA